MDIEKIIEELYYEAMDTKDYRNKGAHVLEIGMSTHNKLYMSMWWDRNCFREDNEWWFRGKFKIVVIYQPIEDKPIRGPEVENIEIPDWHHITIHLQRANGRMLYFDWKGNDKRSV